MLNTTKVIQLDEHTPLGRMFNGSVDAMNQLDELTVLVEALRKVINEQHFALAELVHMTELRS